MTWPKPREKGVAVVSRAKAPIAATMIALIAVLMTTAACSSPCLLCSAGGGVRLQETEALLADKAPQWTPDGKNLVLSLKGEQSFGRWPSRISSWTDLIYLLEAEGKGVQKITPFAQSGKWWYNHAPKVHPDGSRIVLTTFSQQKNWKGLDPSYDVAIADIDGRLIKNLTNTIHLDAMPVWSPDGSKIAFARLHSASTPTKMFNVIGNVAGIYVMDLETGRLRLAYEGRPDPSLFDLTRDQIVSIGNDAKWDESMEGQLTWSPDSSKLAFSIQEGWETRHWNEDFNGFPIARKAVLFTVMADGTGLNRLVETDLELGWQRGVIRGTPAWSPDGEWIAYYRHTPDEEYDHLFLYGLFIVHVDSGESRQLAERIHEPDDTLDWSPDGKFILFSAHNVGFRYKGSSEAKSIYKTDVKTNRTVTLTHGGQHPSWSPNGEKVAYIASFDWRSRAEYPLGEEMPYLYTISPDGSNKTEIGTKAPNRKGNDSELIAASAPRETCFLWWCWQAG